MDPRSIRHHLMDLRRATDEFRQFHDVALAASTRSQVDLANAARDALEHVVTLVREIQRRPGLAAEVQAPIQQHLDEAELTLQRRRIDVDAPVRRQLPVAENRDHNISPSSSTDSVDGFCR